MSNFITKCWSDATRWCIPDKHWWGDRWWCGAMIATIARLVPGKEATRCHEWPQRQGIALSHTLRNVAMSLPYTLRKNIHDISNTYKMQIVLILVSVLQTNFLFEHHVRTQGYKTLQTTQGSWFVWNFMVWFQRHFKDSLGWPPELFLTLFGQIVFYQ